MDDQYCRDMLAEKEAELSTLRARLSEVEREKRIVEEEHHRAAGSTLPADQQEGEGLIEDHEFVACEIGAACPLTLAQRGGCHYNLQPHGFPCAQPASLHRGTKEGQ